LDQLWTYGSNWTHERRQSRDVLTLRCADTLRIDVERRLNASVAELPLYCFRIRARLNKPSRIAAPENLPTGGDAEFLPRGLNVPLEHVLIVQRFAAVAQLLEYEIVWPR